MQKNEQPILNELTTNINTTGNIQKIAIKEITSNSKETEEIFEQEMRLAAELKKNIGILSSF